MDFSARPMPFGEALQSSATECHVEAFDRFRKHIEPGWIEEALEAKGYATLRRRRLPAEQVIWLVLGIAMYRDRSIEEVVDKLDLALPSPKGPVAKSAIPPARVRLGEEPMRWLFHRSAKKWAHESADKHRWRGLALYGIDGSKLRLQDTDENRREFGGWISGKGDSTNPLVRVVVLMALRSHLLAAANFGGYAATSEMQFAVPMVEHIPERSLTVLDKLFLGAALLLDIQKGKTERHWMTPAKTNTNMRVVKELGEGDAIVEMSVSDDARALHPNLPKTWTARAIVHQRPGFPKRTLLTSLLDAVKYPADELRALYHERWELELAYDELKTEMLSAEVTLRSKTAGGVRQELWGILIGFNLVRLEMERIADEAKVPPTRISFVAALHWIRDEWEWSATTRSPGAIPKHLANLRERIKRFILPPRRSERSYPREVKNDYRTYPRRRRTEPAK